MPDQANSGSNRKKFAPRSRRGCSSCRLRKKRCDESRPICANCVRVNVRCEWPAQTDIGSRKRRPRVGYETPTSRGAAASNTITNADMHISPHSPDIPVPMPVQSSFTGDQQYLLTYYITTYVPAFSVVASSAVYHISLYVPMAFQSGGVLNAILASAASHLSKTTADEREALYFSDVAKRHQLACHKHLQKVVYDETSPTRNSIETITILMLLVALETQNGSKGAKWQYQLVCAAKIVVALGGPKHFVDAGRESEYIFSHFLYHDFCATAVDAVQADVDSIRSDRSEALPDWISLCPEGSFDVELNTGLDPLMGVASSLFMTFRQIGRLKQLPYPSAERSQLFTKLERKITQWSVQEHAFEDNITSRVGVAGQLDLITLAESYRLGALILLYRTSHVPSPILLQLAKQIMSLVARLPDGNPAESGLGFPLFMAGGELVDWEDMEACALKLRGIRDRTRIMNIEGVVETLESVWRSRLNGIQKDWVDILREEQKAISVA